MSEKPRKFIPELEGLRGLLALWVFLFHTTRLCGFQLGLISEGDLAVHVFIILSGFMIGRLVTLNPEPYSSYLLRRLARLYPAYLIALALGIATSRLTYVTLTAVPWDFIDPSNTISRHALEQAHFVPNLLAHLTMLHGAFPEEILPVSALGFVGPAWSLSLEWQFYLVAPFVVWLVTSRRFQALAVAGVVIIQLGIHHVLAHYSYPVPSFLPLMLGYFVVGIMSAMLFDRVSALRSDLLVYGVGAATCAVIAAGATSAHLGVPFLIWIVAILASMRPHLAAFRPISWLLTCGPVEYLGRISYGFYVYHTVAYFCTASALLAMGIHSPRIMFAGMIAIALPAVLLMATMSYYGIERPVMHYAKEWARKAAGRAIPA